MEIRNACLIMIVSDYSLITHGETHLSRKIQDTVPETDLAETPPPSLIRSEPHVPGYNTSL